MMPNGHTQESDMTPPALKSRRETRLLISLVWVASVLYVCAMTVADPDLWGHTLYGLRAIEQGVLVERNDPFSYTAPATAWTNHEWLTEYQFGWLWLYLGDTGLWLWRNLMVVGVFAIAAYSLSRARANLAAAAVLLIYSAQCLAGFCTFVRPQLATFVLFAATLMILRTFWDRPQNKSIWILPWLSALWVNLHGGFLAGLAIQALFLVGFAFRALSQTRLLHGRCLHGLTGDQGHHFLIITLASILSLAATLINPYGFQIYHMLWHHLVPEQAVREWQLPGKRPCITSFCTVGRGTLGVAPLALDRHLGISLRHLSGDVPHSSCRAAVHRDPGPVARAAVGKHGRVVSESRPTVLAAQSSLATHCGNRRLGANACGA
jgi:hypothetical protein